MKLRFLSSILIFISAYSPLSIIFLIQDYDFDKKLIKHPEVVYPVIGVSLISCLIVFTAVSLVKTSTPTVKIKEVSNRSGELINYSIPYMISFFAVDLGNLNQLFSFFFFMIIMYWLTLKTHNIFINPVLAILGYNLYEVKYEQNEREYEDFFLVKGERLKSVDKCRIIEISEQLFLVTERNPEV